MRLVILCEGDTEERVLKDFLAPYCTKFGKNVHVISSKGAGNLKNEFQTIAELELRQDRETFVFCLIDVLNAPFSFPKEVMNSTEPYEARYDYIRRYMQELIGEELRSRFFAFPVLMELETWLLADIEALKDYFSPPPSESLRRPPNPESVINPSEELGHWMWRFRNMKYKKTLHGPKLFKLASAKRVYEDNCPHFIQMINELLRA
ncbi:MAG TPA: DUF4276 family protein, partial [Aggregatilineaceae bacterium]|nr:DUF4276 family protein [Aggregatilineaceae bacterium]